MKAIKYIIETVLNALFSVTIYFCFFLLFSCLYIDFYNRNGFEHGVLLSIASVSAILLSMFVFKR